MFFYRDTVIHARTREDLYAHSECPICKGTLTGDWKMPLRYEPMALFRMIIIAAALAVPLCFLLIKAEKSGWMSWMANFSYSDQTKLFCAILAAICLPIAFFIVWGEIKLGHLAQDEKLAYGLKCPTCGNGFVGLVDRKYIESPNIISEESTSLAVCEDLSKRQVDGDLSQTLILVLSGFSGSGKGTISEILKERTIDGKPIEIIRSVTSRPPRSENDNYTFVTKEEFARLVATNQLLEFNSDYADTGYGYGTPIQAVKAAVDVGKIPLLEINNTGLKKLLSDGKVSPTLIRSVFVAAPATDIVLRLTKRGTERKIRSRLQQSIKEVDSLEMYDAVIENIDVESAVSNVISTFEGIPVASSFDTEKFKADMEHILSTCNDI